MRLAIHKVQRNSKSYGKIEIHPLNKLIQVKTTIKQKITHTKMYASILGSVRRLIILLIRYESCCLDKQINKKKIKFFFSVKKP